MKTSEYMIVKGVQFNNCSRQPFMVVERKDLHKLILYNVAKLRNITCMADTEREPS